MRIAALIMAHHRPDCLERLLRRLQGPLWARYLHIDRKSDQVQFAHLAHLAVPMAKRVAVEWGTFSQVEAILLLLRRALEDSCNTHFYLVTGQDYPIRSDQFIADAVGSAKSGGNYISVRAMPQPDKPLSRLEQRCYLNPSKKGLVSIVRKGLPVILPKRNVDRHLRGLSPFVGSGMWILSRDSAEKIISFLQANPWYMRAFKYTRCPDEMFFQTIFAHLGLGLDGDCPTSSFWRKGKSNPELINKEILARVLKSEAFMARKFDLYYPD